MLEQEKHGRRNCGFGGAVPRRRLFVLMPLLMAAPIVTAFLLWWKLDRVERAIAALKSTRQEE